MRNGEDKHDENATIICTLFLGFFPPMPYLATVGSRNCHIFIMFILTIPHIPSPHLTIHHTISMGSPHYFPIYLF